MGGEHSLKCRARLGLPPYPRPYNLRSAPTRGPYPTHMIMRQSSTWQACK